MNGEPDASAVDVDTDEWHLLESDGDESATIEGSEAATIGADAEGRPEPAEPVGAIAADRVQRRHARPRDLRRLQTGALSVALVIAVGFALYFWLQVDSAGDGTPASDSGDLAAQLEEANSRLAEAESELREAQVRLVTAEAEALELQEQLDATNAASAKTEGELAEAAEQLKAVSDSLADVRSQSEALASAVLGLVDPVDACVRAAAQVAQNADQIGRGQLARQARDAATACAAAQESLDLPAGQARDILSD